MNYKFTVEECSTITPKQAMSESSSPNQTNNLEVFVNRGYNPPQNIELEKVAITYGQMYYFVCCGCGGRAAKLYRPPNSDNFRCRKCQKLRYRLSNISSRSIAGRAIHRFQKVEKLTSYRENMSRIFYKGKFTARYNRFLRGCKKVGLDNVVEEANSLRELIQSQWI